VFRVFCANCARTIAFGLLVIAIIFNASAQPAPDPSPQTPPVVSGVIRMPLISPEQADQFFASRNVPQSNVSAPRSWPPGDQPQQILGIAPSLGHELPTEEPPTGFSRADFALAKSRDDKNQALIDSPITFRGAPASTGVREQPPQVVKP
jgi:hypothetical protein